MQHFIHFDGAPVPAIATTDLEFRPARDSLSWEVRDPSGMLVDSFSPKASYLRLVATRSLPERHPALAIAA